MLGNNSGRGKRRARKGSLITAGHANPAKRSGVLTAHGKAVAAVLHAAGKKPRKAPNLCEHQ